MGCNLEFFGDFESLLESRNFLKFSLIFSGLRSPSCSTPVHVPNRCAQHCARKPKPERLLEAFGSSDLRPLHLSLPATKDILGYSKLVYGSGFGDLGLRDRVAWQLSREKGCTLSFLNKPQYS